MDLFASSVFSSPVTSTIFESPIERAARLRRESLASEQSTSSPAATQEQESLLAYLGGGLLSGAGYIGESIDKLGGRPVRNALEGLIGGDDFRASELLSWIPFSDAMGITSRENIVSGKDLLEYDDPNAYIDDWAGTAAEIVLDPLNLATFGTGAALSGGGKLAKAAGVSGSQVAKAAAAKAAAQAASRSAETGAQVAARVPGYLESQVSTSLADLLNFAPDTAERISATAKRQNLDLHSATLLNDPLSGLAGLGLPFRDPSKLLGTGETGRAVAGGLDRLGSSIYNAFPGKNPLPAARALFDASVRGTMQPEVQKLAADGFRAEEEAVYQANLKIADLFRRLDRSGFFKGPDGRTNEFNFVAYVENAPRAEGLQLPDDVRAVADEVRTLLPQMLQDERGAGLVSPQLIDTFLVPDPNSATGAMMERRLDYLPRLPHQFPDAPPHSFGAARPVDTTNPFTAHREDFLRGLPEGTAFIQELSLDPEISGLINRSKSRNGTVPRAVHQQIGQIIRRKYGQQFDDLGVELPGTDRLGEYGKDANKMRELTGFLATLDPRHASQKQPFFANPLQALQARYVASKRAVAHSNVLHDAILGSVKRSDEAAFDEPTRDLWRTLEAAPGVDPVHMGRRLEQSILRQAEQSGTLDQLTPLLDSAVAGIDEARAIREGLELAKQEKRLVPKNLLDKQGNLRLPMPEELQPYVAYARDQQRLKPILEQFVMPRRLVDDATQMLAKWQMPPAVTWLENASRRALNAFKLANTSLFPAFHARNYPSGQFNNIAAGAYTGVGDFLSDTNLADAVMQGRTVPGVAKLLEKQFGQGLSDDEVMDRIRDHVFAAGLLDMGSSLGQADVGGAASHRMLDILSKDNPLTPGGGFAFDKNRTWLQAFPLNPMTMRGVGTSEDLNWYSRGMNQFGTYVEGQNRIAPFLGFLKQGLDPVEAARRAKTAQVDYARSSDFEKRFMTQLVPFYKFTRGQAPFVADNLLSHPAGFMAQAVRESGRLQRDNEFVPESVGAQTSIPLGENEDGSTRYLTGLGLPYENPLGLIRPGVNSFDTAQNVFGGLMSMVNPYIKTPIELAANTQFFSGRRLDDLDSNLGRIVSNVGLTEEPPEVPIVLDQVLANSPLSRLLTTTRQATDSRKWDAIGGLSLLTGLRVTDVDPERAERDAARTAIEKLLASDPAVRVGRPQLYALDEKLLTPQERMLFDLLGTYR